MMRGVSRFQVFTDEQWLLLDAILPTSDGVRGRPFRDHRQVIEGIAYRARANGSHSEINLRVRAVVRTSTTVRSVLARQSSSDYLCVTDTQLGGVRTVSIR